MLTSGVVSVLHVIYVKCFVVLNNNPYICRVEFDKVSVFWRFKYLWLREKDCHGF